MHVCMHVCMCVCYVNHASFACSTRVEGRSWSLLLKSHVGVWYCFAQKGNLGPVSYPIILILEILGSVLGCDVGRRAGLWFVDLGCGSGNVTIAARLFGLNVIAIDQSAYALAIATKRIFGSDEECWTLAFTETV
jgi:SAM-dependent methyltransferase